MKQMKFGFLLLVLSTVFASNAIADGPFPTKPIRMVVPYPPGGGGDTVARPFTIFLKNELGQPVVLDNVPGASGNIGTGIAARAPADGYTMVLGANTLATNPHLTKLSFDPLQDLIPVARVAISPLVVVISPSVKATNLKELIALSKTTPINYGTPGTATPMHLAGELINRSTGSAFTHVPYKGSGGALNDLLGGQIQMMITSLSTVIGHIKLGKLKGIAILSEKRSPQAPDLPTARENGVGDVDTVVWYGFFVPAGTPAPVVGQLEEAFNKSLKNPELSEKFRQAGIDPEFTSGAELKKILKIEYDRWGKVIRDAKIATE